MTPGCCVAVGIVVLVFGRQAFSSPSSHGGSPKYVQRARRTLLHYMHCICRSPAAAFRDRARNCGWVSPLSRKSAPVAACVVPCQHTMSEWLGCPLSFVLGASENLFDASVRRWVVPRGSRPKSCAAPPAQTSATQASRVGALDAPRFGASCVHCCGHFVSSRRRCSHYCPRHRRALRALEAAQRPV